MKAPSILVRLFHNITRDDSPASYYFVCGIAAIILCDTLAILGYEAFQSALLLVHAVL